MKIKVAVEPAMYPELYAKLAALPERSRAEKLRSLASQALAAEQGRAPQDAVESGRMPGGEASGRLIIPVGQQLTALPVASGPLKGNAATASDRLSAVQVDKGANSQPEQALGALPVAGEVPAGKGLDREPAVAVQTHAEVPTQLEEAAPKGLPTAGGEALNQGAAAARSNEEANRAGALNLAVMMAKRGVFTG